MIFQEKQLNKVYNKSVLNKEDFFNRIKRFKVHIYFHCVVIQQQLLHQNAIIDEFTSNFQEIAKWLYKHHSLFIFKAKLSKINWYFTLMYTELNEQVKYLKHQALKMFNQIKVSIDVCNVMLKKYLIISEDNKKKLLKYLK